ncbi:CdaR family protein [Romboutsia sp. Marseille-P6047]|uniref:CdaR family protein n=1 Tax=Romboutsia sp. Marseille-P6047 TaxID=2161817 RepID=UPI000F055714|nr:CdaR family protein [Romboutsia sp. Marseille-P6047]
MIEKLKENTKIKLISLLSALVLWMYVVLVVDPQETKTFENIPVTITNMDELTNSDFVIYPEADLTTSIYITGKLSALKNVSKDDIRAYGTIINPKEGNNALYLKADISKGVSYAFKPDTLIISLEKVVEEKRLIDVSVKGKYKDNLDVIDLEKESIKISGPRSLVQQVQKLQATLTLDESKSSFLTSLKLIPIDENGTEVKGVELENSSVNADVTLLVEKNVPISAVFTDENIDKEQYKISQNTITIKGKKDIVDTITSINTQPIDVTALKVGEPINIKLEVPNGIVIGENINLTVQLESLKGLTSKFSYGKDDIEIRNNRNIDISTLDIPESVEVDIEYNNDLHGLNKSDITLYIDASEQSDSYPIRYESKFEFNAITINPNIITYK